MEGRDLLVFADDWGRFPSSMQHLGRHWARANRVLWVGSLGLRRPRVGLNDAARVWEKARAFVRRPPGIAAAAPEDVMVHHPPVIPFHDFSPVRSVNARMLRRSLRGRLAHAGFRDVVLFTSSPVAAPVIGALGERSSHYFCLDDYSLFEGAFACLPAMERDLLKNVDSCFAVSRTLQETRVPATGRAFHLPQGVDAAHFTPEGEVHPAVASLPKPVVGFFGLVASWVDVDLMRACAAQYPKATFVIVGRTAPDARPVRPGGNLVMLGEVPYRELPSFARGFDLGLVPFVVNDLTVAANPLKLLEYLSLGLPVVSTDLPEIRPFADVVSIAGDRASFLEAVGRALEEAGGAGLREARRARAAAFSWEAVARRVGTTVVEIEREKRVAA